VDPHPARHATGFDQIDINGVCACNLIPDLAKQFQSMSETEVESMMASLNFENDVQRRELAEIVRKYTV
jgi:hypothetical protein